MATADGGERVFPLTRKRTVVGRDSRCDLRVAVPNVALRHCEIVTDGNTLRISDLGSEAGTLHNGERIQSAVLAPEDRITIGPVTFVVRIDAGGR
jgi:pSer/pThr/pTyr-binding forkhead associated (FHA) protein